jgi:hypothetical protein
MFRQWASQLSNGADELFDLHPATLVELLEYSWDNRTNCLPYQQFLGLDVGSPVNRSGLSAYPGHFTPSTPGNLPIASFPQQGSLTCTGVIWDHLIYAYMIENTRIYEIFRKVLFEYLHGERLGSPNPATQNWIRNTEELFYRDSPPFSITTLTSHIRSDMRGSRRNAYQRMFGMDLNHGTEENKPYSYTRADAANNEFVSTFEELLREVWIGIVNEHNTSGANPTDNGKIANLAEYLYNMLTARREYGMLSREEFTYVSMMSWFHLTVDYDSPIVRDLKAEAASPEQRLFKIAQRVGIPAHGLSRNYFEIAPVLSKVLTLIELGLFRNSVDVRAFYTTPSTPPPPQDDLPAHMNSIITHWSIITGRDLKARKVAAT